MKTSTCGRPEKASIAAAPVSPEVAPTIVARWPRAFSAWSTRRAEKLHREVLEGERRTVEQLQREQIVVELHERGDRGMPKARIGRLDHAAQGGRGDLSASIGRDDGFGDVGVGLAGDSLAISSSLSCG